MNTKKITWARMALRWGLGLLVSGIAIFYTIIFMQLSPIQSPVAFWQNVLLAAVIMATLGAILTLLVGLTIVPAAFALSRQHLQTHGQSYTTVFAAIITGVGLLLTALTELVKTHGPTVAEMMDTDDEEKTGVNSGSPYIVGSDEWYIDYIHDEH